MSLLNGITGLGSGVSALAGSLVKGEERAALLPLMSRAEPVVEKAETLTPATKLAGPRMPYGQNPYGDNPHAQALWLAERAIVGPESGGRADAQNKVSSAGGLFQITNSTFTSALQNMGITPPSSQAELNALKYNPDLNTKVMRTINTEAAGALAAAGLPVTVQTLQAAHRLGPGGAMAAVKAAMRDPDAPLVGNGLAPDAVRGNGDIARLTVGQFLERPYPGAKEVI